MSKGIYLDAPNIGEREKKYLNNAVDSGYVSTAGPFVKEFEERFSGYLGIKKAVSTQSGTAAIHVALHELGIGHGDEVIVPALTFIATVNPVMYVGARPVFVDVDLKTWNISPDEIRKNITKNTKAIIPVHLYGNPCYMDEIVQIASEHKLHVIEDATESLGAKYKGRLTGTFGDFGCFSFNGNKVITTGGGGMVAGSNTERLDHIKFLVNQARDEERGYYHPEIGFNYRMTNIEAALGLSQMERLDDFLSKKKRFNERYRQGLKGVRGVRFQEEYEGSESSCWLTCISIDNKIDISALQSALKTKGIPTRRVFMPITEFPPYKRYKNTDMKNTYQIYENSLCLPGSTLNTEEDVAYVCKTLKEIVS
ncbi:MAG: LegC family aminotransferase [Nitrospirae bacterium]|nr:LegC family aminotransferase [Nitrospirota bacterium]MCL5978913.1 LegC family aminotransferase [Nitrospirota bacterium]